MPRLTMNEEHRRRQRHHDGTLPSSEVNQSNPEPVASGPSRFTSSHAVTGEGSMGRQHWGYRSIQEQQQQQQVLQTTPETPHYTRVVTLAAGTGYSPMFQQQVLQTTPESPHYTRVVNLAAGTGYPIMSQQQVLQTTPESPHYTRVVTPAGATGYPPLSQQQVLQTSPESPHYTRVVNLAAGTGYPPMSLGNRMVMQQQQYTYTELQGTVPALAGAPAIDFELANVHPSHTNAVNHAINAPAMTGAYPRAPSGRFVWVPDKGMSDMATAGIGGGPWGYAPIDAVAPAGYPPPPMAQPPRDPSMLLHYPQPVTVPEKLSLARYQAAGLLRRNSLNKQESIVAAGSSPALGDMDGDGKDIARNGAPEPCTEPVPNDSSQARKDGLGKKDDKSKKKPSGFGTLAERLEGKCDSKPKRALSAYNIFFKEERAKLLRDECKKIGFASMAKVISFRWKHIDQERLADCQKQADNDTKRYQGELLIYKRKRCSALTETQLELEASVSAEIRAKYFANAEEKIERQARRAST